MQRGIEVTVGDAEYRVTTFTASKGLKYLQKILKIVGPAVGELFAKAAAEGDIAEAAATVDDQALSFAISELTKNLDDNNVAGLIQDMIKDAVTKNGQDVNFNQEFSGNYGALVKLIGVIIKENFSSFFGESGFGALQELLPQPQSNNE